VTSPDPTLGRYAENGRDWPVLAWRAPPGWRGISSAVLGGGIGPITGWVNAMVDLDYSELDPAAHVAGLAAGLALDGPPGLDGPPALDRYGLVGMLTAADVRQWQPAEDDGVRVFATVGLGVPTLAAAPDGDLGVSAERVAVGTINLLITVPVPLSDAALVNAVITATEAKTQALADAGYRATGTASDAVCLACPAKWETSRSRFEASQGSDSDPLPDPVQYGGPRSEWGARVARAVHRSVLAGALNWRATHLGI
jgi:adenosylcobinamide amidohydrolase